MSAQVDGRSQQPDSRAPAGLRRVLEQALVCVDAAVESVATDPEAALDDVVAARLLLTMALAVD